MRCHTCKKPLKNGDLVVPVLKIHDTGRSGPMPASQPEKYIHLEHLSPSTEGPIS